MKRELFESDADGNGNGNVFFTALMELDDQIQLLKQKDEFHEEDEINSKLFNKVYMEMESKYTKIDSEAISNSISESISDSISDAISDAIFDQIEELMSPEDQEELIKDEIEE